MVQEAVQRILQMEQRFDQLQKAANENPNVLSEDASLNAALQALTRYYESGQ